ncbi:MAG: hypothetical protein RBU30_18830 [Polyangia bacterium]|jgi:hypothetical protein|nr:hypothetical protein [Polyangia bacterium]
MGFIQAIINFFKRLFGIGGSEPKALSAAQAATDGAASGAASAPDEDEPYAQQEWREIQEFIAQVEAQGIDLAGMNLADPVSYWVKAFAIEEAEAQGGSKQQAIRQQGFSNDRHWEIASQYFLNKWCELVTNEEGELEVRQKAQFTNGALKARQGQMQAGLAQAEAANPQLLMPVEGVTVEQWAQIASGFTKLSPTSTPADVSRYLAQFGMDKAKYDRVNGEWMNRMSQDHTMVIANKYGAAFSGSMGVSAGGAEPISFERYVEVMAAQEAWAAQGMDVNAQLRAVFGVDAATYGSWGTYWSPRMSTDVELSQRWSTLRDQYIQKYKGAGMDDDLSL